jgi:peptidyl-prolyl cis-trans isomerase C
VVPEQRHLRNIVVAERSDADAIVSKIRAGKDFAVLARQRSLDATSRDVGGDLGLVPVAALEKPYGDAAFAAAEGQLFGPIRTTSGWNVGQVVQIVLGRPLGYDEVSATLKTRLTLDRKMVIWRSFITDQLRRTRVTYAATYQPDNPDTVPTDDGDIVPADDSTRIGRERSGTTKTVPAVLPDRSGTANAATPIPESGEAAALSLAVVQLVVAAALLLIGRWGWRNADRLPLSMLPAVERGKRTSMLRRGAMTSQVAGALLAMAVVVSLIRHLTG